jgi:hypothetical protein
VKRCTSYYQNIDTQYRPIGAPRRCTQAVGHPFGGELHRWGGNGRGIQWPDSVQMIHPWQARAVGHGPNCVPDPAHPGYWICDLATHPQAAPEDVDPPEAPVWLDTGEAQAWQSGWRSGRVRAPHQHEKWQLQESAKGGMYCAACGEDVQLPLS